MLTRLSLLFFLAVMAAIALATPQITPAPAPPNPELENRQLDSFLSNVSSYASSLYSVATSKGGQLGDVFTSVESVAGSYYTIVSSKGGKAITLGGDVVTGAFGSVYTILKPTSDSSQSAALAMGLQTPLLVGLATVMLSTLLGAIIVS